MNLDKIKMTMSVFFFLVGITASYLTYNMLNNKTFGTTYRGLRFSENEYGFGTGVDSADDGVAIGFGIISGFSFLSSTLLLTSLTPKNHKDN